MVLIRVSRAAASSRSETIGGRTPRETDKAVLSPETPPDCRSAERHFLEQPAAARTIASLLAFAIFLVDTLSPLEGAVAVLYVLVVLIAARSGLANDLLVASGAGATLTVAAFLWSHGLDPTVSSLMRAAVSLAAIGIATLLAHRSVAATESLLRANEALRRSERRYRRMFATSRIGVLEEDWSAVRRMLDDIGADDAAALTRLLSERPNVIEDAKRLPVVMAANPEARRMLGKAGNDSLGSLDLLLAPSDRTFERALAAFASGAPSFEGETEILRADGRAIPVLFSVTFPSEPDEEAALAFMMDVSERREAQEAMLAAQAELAHAARVATLGELTASITHEVNQPLTAIVTNGEAALRWLKRGEPDLAEALASVTRAVAEGKRASAIVHRIRGFLAKTPAVHVPLNVANVLADGVRLVERDIARYDVALKLRISRALPTVRGDAIELQQVVVNLLLNAAQAMSETEGPRSVALSALRCEDGGVLIEVSDTGPGVAEDHLEKVFQPFHTTKPDGMGMGLAICRSIASSHGGRLWVTSEPGRGALFHLQLPASS